MHDGKGSCNTVKYTSTFLFWFAALSATWYKCLLKTWYTHFNAFSKIWCMWLPWCSTHQSSSIIKCVTYGQRFQTENPLEVWQVPGLIENLSTSLTSLSLQRSSMIFKELGKIFEKDLQRCHLLTLQNQATTGSIYTVWDKIFYESIHYNYKIKYFMNP